MAMETESPDDYNLPIDYAKVHLNGINAGARRLLAMHLNLEGSLNDNAGMVNNYEGLAEMVGFNIKEILNFGRQKSPCEELLADWSSRPDLAPTVGALWENLKTLERFDVLTDIWKYIKRDCDRYLALKAELTPEPIQDPKVSSGGELQKQDDVMTIDDVESLTPTTYDAFVCYNPEGPDIGFVRKLIEELEVKNGLKLFVPWRDDLPGAAHNSVCAQLIEHRCRRMIIVLSPRYLQSPSCDFQTKFAQSLSPGSRGKRLIPVLIEDCVIPELLRFITCCNYTKKEVLEWFWNRLIMSVKQPLDGFQDSKQNSQQNSQLSSVNLDTSMRLSELSNYASSGSTSSFSSMSSASSASSGQSSMSSRSDQSFPSGSDYTISGGGMPTYLEFQPASPQTQRKFNNYEKMSQLVRGGNRPRQPSPNNKKKEKDQTQYVYSYSTATEVSGVQATRSDASISQSSLQPRGRSPLPPHRSPQTTGSDVPPPLPPREESKKLAQKSKTDQERHEYFC